MSNVCFRSSTVKVLASLSQVSWGEVLPDDRPFSCLNSQFGCDMSKANFLAYEENIRRHLWNGNDFYVNSLSDSFSPSNKQAKTIINSYHSHFDELSWETFLSIRRIFAAPMTKALVTHRKTEQVMITREKAKLPITGSSILVVTWWHFSPPYHSHFDEFSGGPKTATMWASAATSDAP